ncbi:MAG TPA: aminotransferase class V-fold PLP-dependent enzyme [Acidimicrobiales bacterium]|nr:aminotransferase class V-fold PLP-dependent enzyme [Acidimicrobiales bacterium]
MARAYLDHASTTPARPEAVDALSRWAALPPGDPGRLHEEARVVRDALEESRQAVAELLGTVPRQVVFTSGATEAINAAVWGACRATPGAPVLCAAVEHSAVRDASVRSAPVETLPVDGSGRLDVEALRARLEATDLPRPALVHCQWANHEVGTLQPVHEVVALCRETGVTVHVDAAAACGHVPTDLGALDADLVSISAHKLGGAPGAGALVVRRGSRFEPLLVGGAQERGRRGGLEPIPALLAFGAAAAALANDEGRAMEAEAGVARRQIAAMVHGALAVDGVEVVGAPAPEERLPHLICLGVHGVEAEPVLIGLDRAGVAVHSGSACASEAIEPSPVLEAMGADPSHSLRVSVGWTTTDEDGAAFVDSFARVVAELRALRG